MPTPAKAQGNSTKHRTKQEIAAREAAEASTKPTRDAVKLRKPALVKNDKEASRYWSAILRELKGADAELLDNLDSEVFAGYCSMLAMRDRVAMVTPMLMECAQEISETARALARQEEADPEAAAELAERAAGMLKSCAQLSDKRLKLDNTILSYAEKLGLTPSGRARLAVKRAADPAEELGDMAALLPFAL